MRDPTRRWFLGTIAICLFLIGVEAAVFAAMDAVSRRDIGWTPGPLAEAQDLVFNWSWTIALVVLLLTETPTIWWRRLGGTAGGVLGIAFICPMAAFAPSLVPKGYSEDGLVLVGGSIFLFLVAIAASALIMVFVGPVADADRSEK